MPAALRVFAALAVLGMCLSIPGWSVASSRADVCSRAGYDAEGCDRANRAKIESMVRDFSRAHPGVPEITVAEFLALGSDTPVVLVDVRPPKERAVSMIPGAVSQERFEGNREAYAGRLVVAYCTIGHRSGLYTEELVRQGVLARNLRGSLLAWAHADRAFANGSGETRRAHVYGRRWNLLPDGFEGTW